MDFWWFEGQDLKEKCWFRGIVNAKYTNKYGAFRDFLNAAPVTRVCGRYIYN